MKMTDAKRLLGRESAPMEAIYRVAQSTSEWREKLVTWTDAYPGQIVFYVAKLTNPLTFRPGPAGPPSWEINCVAALDHIGLDGVDEWPWFWRKTTC